MRLIVKEIFPTYITTDEKLVVDISGENFSYLQEVLWSGAHINCLHCKKENGRLYPKWIIVEPDFLIDISSIARCFTACGSSPLLYFINRFTPPLNNRAVLLGNYAGVALDDAVSDVSNGKRGWKASLKCSFSERALEYITCDDLFKGNDFKIEAERQYNNIRDAVEKLEEKKNDVLLEPSFLCETLGLQGRVDMIKSDLSLLIEQKSGKNFAIDRGFVGEHGFFRGEDHFVQLLLYAAVLSENFKLNIEEIDIRLLYSKYTIPQGLVKMTYNERLLTRAFELRNKIVAIEFKTAKQSSFSLLDNLNVEQIYGLSEEEKGVLFEKYIKPQTESFLTPLNSLSVLERRYVEHYIKFVLNEEVISKTSFGLYNGNSTADLWKLSVKEKLEDGNIFTDLELLSYGAGNSNKDGEKNIETLIFKQKYNKAFLPNFRLGDMIYLYSYKADVLPSVLHSILLRGTLTRFDSREVEVHLDNAIHSISLFEKKTRFAIEHSSSDVNSTSSLKALYLFAMADKDKRNLLLSQREPKVDKTLLLNRSYDKTYDEVLLKVKRAKDYFLLIGPPGTGKTSLALRYMVEEELSSDGDVLLLSYTNRAVDEICDMLIDAKVNFVRIGREYSMEERFRPFLLSTMASNGVKLSDLKSRIMEHKVYVTTTSTMMKNLMLLSLKNFSLTIVDEASQILEPNIIGILSKIKGRFVLVGDHKQLPAVVQQSAEESAIDDELLEGIGIIDTRQSLFERLLRYERSLGREDFIGTLNRQGRMHPEVADFAMRMFYKRERLKTVPLPHQEERGELYPKSLFSSSVLNLYRNIFIPSKDYGEEVEADKANEDEARIIVSIIKDIKEYYGERFDIDKTLGVIVPYRRQIAVLLQELERENLSDLKDITIDTVERYQGSQRDVIIYSFTIKRGFELDFLTENSFEEDGKVIDRKLNVALTRARRQMIVVGNERILRQNKVFAEMIDAFYKVDRF